MFNIAQSLRKKDISISFFVLFTFAFIIFFYLRLTNKLWFIFSDSTIYLEGARSLAHLKGYTDSAGNMITIYPPATSLIYALAALFSPDDYYLYNLFTKLFAIAFLLFSFLFLKKRVGNTIGLFAVLFLTFSRILIGESALIMSDIVFSFFFILILYFFDAKKLEYLSIPQTFLLGSMISLCYYIRTVGLFIFAGYSLVILLSASKSKLRTLMILSVVFCSAAALLFLYNSRAGHQLSYFSLMFLKDDWIPASGTVTMSEWGERLLHNFIAIVQSINYFFSNRYLFNPVGLTMNALLGIGALSAFGNKELRLYSFLLLFYLMELLTAVAYLPDRYLIPIAPILVLYLVIVLKAVFNFFPSKIKDLPIIAVLIIFSLLTQYWQGGYQRYQEILRMGSHKTNNNIIAVQNQNLQKMVEDHISSLKPGDVVASDSKWLLRYLMPRSVIVKGCTLTLDVDAQYDDLIQRGVNYLYLSKESFRFKKYFLPMVEKFKKNFVVIAEDQKSAIYRTNFSGAARSQ